MEMSRAAYRRGSFSALAAQAAGVAMALIYPPVCLTCGVMTGRHGALCPACWRAVRFIDWPFCEITGAPFDHDRGEGLVSAAAIADPPAYDRARAAVLHEGPARKLAHGLKYADRGDLAPIMAMWMARAGRELIDVCDAIVPVPLHRGRLFLRRYNQSAELARALARLTGRPLVSGALVRRRATRPQVGLGKGARLDNVAGAFTIDARRSDAIAGRHVLLIDDVLTTGATVNAAARVLRRGGATGVDVLTFARVASEGAESLYA